MRFLFDDDQLLFRDSVRALLAKECTPASLRALGESETARSRELWAKLAAIGLLGLRVPEAQGGMGLSEIDFVLPLEETGRAGLAEPVVETAAVAAPLLAELAADDPHAARLLSDIAGGEAIVTVGHDVNAFTPDAHVADFFLLPHAGEVHLVPAPAVRRQHQPSIDPLRRLFTLEWTAASGTRLADGQRARALLDAALDRGALATAAQLVGTAQALLDAAVAYACTREQFGQAIGAFQAIKHLLANVAVRIEFARPVVYLAAWACAHAAPERAVAASHAKAAAAQAAALAAKTALQVHGAIGYTWEVDLHFWMKRAWSLDTAWGSAAWHRSRIAERVLEGDAPAPTFGFES